MAVEEDKVISYLSQNSGDEFIISNDYLNLKNVMVQITLDNELMFETTQVLPLIIKEENVESSS